MLKNRKVEAKLCGQSRQFNSTTQPGPEILQMLDQFRQMLSDGVRIGLAENVTSLKSLSTNAYNQLANCDVMSYYKLCAISKATELLRSY
jgi:hypothetical protein